MQHKPLLIAAVTALALGGSILVSTQAFAQSDSQIGNPRENLVEKLATKFGVRKEDVEAVFDQNRQEMMAKRQAEYTEKLNTLVSQGKITEEQRQLILSKHAQLHATVQSQIEKMRTLTPQERKAFMETERTKLKEWATQHGIDIQYVVGAMGRGPGMSGNVPHAFE